jgi:hypothetical protein
MNQNGSNDATIDRVLPQSSPFQGENVGKKYQAWNFGRQNDYYI